MAKRKVIETSKEAYDSLKPIEIAEIYTKILSSLGVLGEATFEEIAAHAKVEKSRVWKRMNELLKMGKVYRPGNKRKLKSGRNGFTWMLTNGAVPKVEKEMSQYALRNIPSISDYSKDLIPKSEQPKLF